jgi:hypothetical protein
MENQKLITLRQKHPVFTYQSSRFEHNDTTLSLYFQFSLSADIHLETKLLFHGITADQFHNLNKEVLYHWTFQIGMVEAISYWKATCSPLFVVKAGYLNSEQLIFWQSLIRKGLSEFFFVNKIDGWQEDFLQFKVEVPEQSYSLDQSPHTERIIVPMGGGKDSVVSLELLAETNDQLTTLTIQPTDQVLNLLKVAQKKHPHLGSNILIERHLDPQILQLNEAGYLNGHTPFSAMAAFVTTFAAYLFDYKYVAVSNEFSANEGNTIFLGQTINHQYSKTVEFENNFRLYCRDFLSSTVEYFSYVRPLHEIQIARIFAHFSEYFPVFLSCNRGQKTGHWCGECAKCLFVYTMLSPFVEPETLIQIWGQDLFAKESLQEILDELAGVIECKSFDCVGTREEMLVALYLTVEKRSLSSADLPVLLQYAKNRLVRNTEEWKQKANALLSQFESENFVPAQYVHILEARNKEIN